MKSQLVEKKGILPGDLSVAAVAAAGTAVAGAVIGIPHDAEHVLKIDTRNDSATVFGSVGAGTGAALPICETSNFSEGSHFAF